MFMRMFDRGPRVATIDPAEAVARAQAGEVVVVDIRGGDEVAGSGRAHGAVHIPMPVLAMKADPRSPELHPELSTGKPVVLYCRSGARAEAAGQMLIQMGYAEVYNLGGLMHWQMGGGAIAA